MCVKGRNKGQIEDNYVERLSTEVNERDYALVGRRLE